MAQGISGGTGILGTTEKVEKITPHIVVDSVKVRERELIVDVPLVVFEEVKYEKPVIVEKKLPTVKYVVTNMPTTKYEVIDRQTIRFVPKEVEYEKPIIREMQYEKPVVKEVIYEKPKVVEKEVEVVRIKDIELIKELTGEVIAMQEQMKALKLQLAELRNYRLIEQEVVVPKLQWKVVKAERIEWVNVKRERPDADTCT